MARDLPEGFARQECTGHVLLVDGTYGVLLQPRTLSKCDRADPRERGVHEVMIRAMAENRPGARHTDGARRGAACGEGFTNASHA